MKLEHANLTVISIGKAIRFLKTVFPEFEVRGEGEGGEGKKQRRWVHLGTDSTYIALEEIKTPPLPLAWEKFYHPGLNHLCFEVDNIDAINERLLATGYPARPAPKEKFRKRLYVDDNMGDEWEFVEYFSKVPSEKNLYE